MQGKLTLSSMHDVGKMSWFVYLANTLLTEAVSITYSSKNTTRCYAAVYARCVCLLYLPIAPDNMLCSLVT